MESKILKIIERNLPDLNDISEYERAIPVSLETDRDFRL